MAHLRTHLRSLLAAVVAISMLGVPTPAARPDDGVAVADKDGTVVPRPTTPPLEARSRVITHPVGDEELLRLGRWALARFDAARLRPPPIEIHMHRDRDACLGHRGLFHAGEMRVDVCTAEELVVLHEIAHAWTHVNVPDRVRSAYVDAGGFESWDAPGTSWRNRGSEDAADTIAWALLEESIAMPTPDGPIAGMNARYRLLTGADAPRIVVSK